MHYVTNEDDVIGVWRTSKAPHLRSIHLTPESNSQFLVSISKPLKYPFQMKKVETKIAKHLSTRQVEGSENDEMRPTRQLHLDPSKRLPLLRSQKGPDDAPQSLPVTRKYTHPSKSSAARAEDDASLSFIGNATTIIEWRGLRILTDPNFLHAGDHVHLGPGVTAQRVKNPAVDLEELPPIDLVLLSHYHEDHFDRLVEEKLNRDFIIVTTPHAKECLTSSERYASRDEGGPFRAVHDVDTFESLMVHIGGGDPSDGRGRSPVIKIVAMPGKHVPPGPLTAVNNLLGAVPPTNGWLLEMGWSSSGPGSGSDDEAGQGSQSMDTGYRTYISGDTLFVDELKEIPKYIREQQTVQHSHSSSDQATREEGGGGDTRIDLMIAHLGGTTIGGPKVPLIMVTMDAKQGIELMRLLNPDLTIPVHFDDYDIMLSSLLDFKYEVANMGEEWKDKVVYLDRGEQFTFKVRES
ncbi:Metallo-hydrolase/oxidoreductase [Xylaria sp. CBS 124048]|nr:Metallo-hydrolase/oxidoreductase [Xylaria sp. CBS 124048]